MIVFKMKLSLFIQIIIKLSCYFEVLFQLSVSTENALYEIVKRASNSEEHESTFRMFLTSQASERKATN